MSKRTNTKSSEVKEDAKVATSTAKKKETKTTKETKAPKETKKKETKKEVVTETVTETETATLTGEEDEKKKRSAPTKESVLLGFDAVLTAVEEEIARIRENSKSKGVKFLRTLGKKLKNLKSVAARAMRQKNKVERKNNNNSGFQKPVVISKEMAKFAGWDVKDLKSRVEVTKQICSYIKEHDLQDPTDRRKIRADEKLSKLLNYDSKSHEPLTYYRLQTHMKPHFVKTAVPAATTK